MKLIRISLLAILLASGTTAFAQESPDLEKTSEIKVNALYLLLGGLEVQYEKIINEESSFGVSATYFFDDDVEYNWGITPHYRLFFGNQPALGFFVEGQASIFGQESYDYFNGVDNGNVTSFGAGIAVGGKFKSKRDVVVEIYAGLGRVFNDSRRRFSSTYPRLGINIGKRF